MLFSDISFKVKFFSFIVPLVVLFLLTYGLLSLMDKHSDGIMKTTKYVLTNEEGMGFYDSPGGYVFFKLLPVVMGSLAGGSGRSSKGASVSGRAAHKCCSTCSRYNGTHCSDNPMQTILDPDSNCCSSYTRGI